MRNLVKATLDNLKPGVKVYYKATAGGIVPFGTFHTIRSTGDHYLKSNGQDSGILVSDRICVYGQESSGYTGFMDLHTVYVEGPPDTDYDDLWV